MSVWDKFKKKLKKSELAKWLTEPRLGSGRSAQTATPQDDLTPEKLRSIIRRAENGDPAELFDLAKRAEQLNLHYQGVLRTRKLAVRKRDYHVKPASEEDRDIQIAAEVQDLLEQPRIREGTFALMDAIAKGVACGEIEWDFDARNSEGQTRWCPVNIVEVEQRWLVPDRVNPHVFRLRENGQDIDLVPGKFVLHFPRAMAGTPVETGLIQGIAWMNLFKSMCLKDLMLFLDIFSHPRRVGKYHSSATEEEKDALRDALISMGIDTASVIPQSTEVDVQSVNVTGHSELFSSVLEFFDHQISKVVLGQTGTTDVISGGGYASSKVHDEVRDDLAQADADALAMTIAEQIVHPYVLMNFGPHVRCPSITLVAEEDVPLDQFLTGVELMINNGGDVTEADVRERLRLKTPEEGQKLLTRPGSAVTSPEVPDDSQDRETAAAIRRRLAAADDQVNLDVDALISEGFGPEVMNPIFHPLVELIDSDASMKDVLDELDRLRADMDAGRFVDQLTEAQFFAHLAGLFGVEERRG